MQRTRKAPGPQALALAWALAAAAAQAQPTPPADAPALTLPALFARAWAQQPEARSEALRRDAAQAAQDGAQAWTPEPPALQLQTKTDRPGSNLGSREYEAGLALPLWLPGERTRKSALADAERQALDGRRKAAQWRLAASVRGAWWAHQRAQSDLDLAQDRLRNAQGLAADVLRRYRAGDLARADQFQADAAVAQADAAVAEAQGARDAARALLAVWVGGPGGWAAADANGPEPDVQPGRGAALTEAHPAMAEWQAQAEVARRAADLAAAQGRANPELTVAATRGRDQAGDRYRQSVTVGLRVPFWGGRSAQAKQATALAEALEAETRAEIERTRLTAEIDAAMARARGTAAQQEAMARHAALARETRGFIDKAFRLGEADWPTRLRVEMDAAQAERQLARARIDAAAAVSTLRQALGLLPE